MISSPHVLSNVTVIIIIFVPQLPFCNRFPQTAGHTLHHSAGLGRQNHLGDEERPLPPAGNTASMSYSCETLPDISCIIFFILFKSISLLDRLLLRRRKKMLIWKLNVLLFKTFQSVALTATDTCDTVLNVGLS